MYVAIVLAEESHDKLVDKFGHLWGSSWKTYAHHMTVHMGRPNNEEISLIGQYFSFTVDSIAKNDKVVACGVSKESIDDHVLVHVVNKRPHITLAVNVREGGKPVMSNQLESWEKIEPIIVRGRYEEVTN